MSSVTWLHLSDWHQKGTTFDRLVVRDALLRDIKERCQGISADLETIDFIVLSGDIAYSGKPEEYAAVREHLIVPLLDATGLGPERLFIVPGNHDLDRDALKYLPSPLLSPFATEADIQEYLNGDKWRGLLLQPFEAYKAFVAEFGGGALSSYASELQLDIDGKKVALLGFNSALMAGRHKDAQGEVDDDGHLIVGEPQIYDLLAEAAGADLRIAILHHPLAWLTPFDRDRVKGRLLPGVDCILCGHQHEAQVEIFKGTEGECVVIPAGAAYERRDHANGYNFVTLDLATRQGTVFLRCWSDTRAGRWREDVDCASQGKYDFSLSGARPASGQGPAARAAGEATEPGARFDPRNPVFYVPYRQKGEGVIGREEALANLRQQLLTGRQTAIGHTAAFQGLGGLGKTQLAVEYAYRFRAEYSNGVIWINADQDIEPQLIHIAKTAAWLAPKSEHAVILEVALRRLKTVSDCLVVFDNVESFTTIEPYLPEPQAAPHLLLTSRAPQPNFIPVQLPPLNPQQSLAMLCREARREAVTLSAEERQAAQGIVDALDGLPLAIEIAGAYLAHIPGCSFQEYLGMLRGNQRAALDGTLLSSFTKHERDLYSTLRISEPVLGEQPLLREVIDLLAWSGSAFMSLSLMGAMLDRPEVELRPALLLGEALRLLTREAGGTRYDMHRLVCQVRREEVGLTPELVTARCRKLGTWFEERREDFVKLAEIEREMDHLGQWLINARNHATDEVCRLVWLQAYPPYHWGRYWEAHDRVQEARQLLPQKDDDDTHKLAAHVFSDLGSTYGFLGEYDQALEYQQRALAIRQGLFGDHHRDTAASLDNIGQAFMGLEDYPKALDFHQRSLAICQQLFGERASETANSIDNVGSAYGKLGDYRKALNFNLRALSIRQELFGDRHPHTAASLNNVGISYSALRDYSKALAFHQQSLFIGQDLLGDKHPDTACSWNNIGLAYRGLRQYRQALKAFEEALSIREAVLGVQHPRFLDTFNNLISVLIETREFTVAITHARKRLSQVPLASPASAKIQGLQARIDRACQRKGFRPVSAKQKAKGKKRR